MHGLSKLAKLPIVVRLVSIKELVEKDEGILHLTTVAQCFYMP